MGTYTVLALPKKCLVSVSEEPQIAALKFRGLHRKPWTHSELLCNEFLSKEGNQFFYIDDITQQNHAKVCR